ncbi:MAG: acetate--CoA ligase family protein [Candidatus Humimicrobiaceae bacterium]
MIKFSDLETDYNLKTVKSYIAVTKEEAVRYASDIGYPVALKIESPDILHKSDIGAVKLNIKDAKQLSFAYDEILASVKKSFPYAKIDGISVQEMLPEGFEIIIGYTNDKVFGPCIMAGMGGIFTEAVKDISFKVLPITRFDAESMIKELKFSSTLLKGFRHIKSVPVDVISDVLFKVSNLAQDNIKSIKSFDINPAIFFGNDYRIVDFKYVKKSTKQAQTSDMPNTSNLNTFFNASSIAIVGASPAENKLGYTILNNLITNSYKGRLYPVNPKYSSIQGLKSYPDITSILDSVELVIITVSLGDVVNILSQCNNKAIKNVIIISAGGKESGNADIEDKIKETANNYGIRILGCNCIGVYDAKTKIDSMFFSYQKMKRPMPGNICLMSQSGTVGLSALDILPKLSKFVSYGNRIDVDEADLLKYFSSCNDTKVISVYIEGLLKGRKFYDTLKSVTPEIPVVIYKAGRTELASKAAMSHTGFLSGTHNMISGILKQAKAVEVDSFEALLSASRTLSVYDRVSSNNTLIVTNGAGVTIQAIDRVEAKKIINLANLSDSSANKLRESFASHVSLANPVDLTGTATEADFEAVLACAAADENIDIIMLYVVFQCSPITENMIDIIAKYAVAKPIVFCSAGAEHTDYMKSLLEKRGIPAFTSVEEWVSAAEALAY